MSDYKVPFLNLHAPYEELRGEFDAAYRRVMESGRYLLGPELSAFEMEFAAFVGAEACAGVGSGLDALILGLRVLDVGPGDEVIVPSNTYIATWLAVAAVGAEVVPVDPDPGTYNITAVGVAAAISVRTAAILPVHLYGRPCDVHGIETLAREREIPTLYDAAQSQGATVGGVPVGSCGSVVAWSFYPGKNLGAFADGGAVTSNYAGLVDRVKLLRNYGSSAKYINDEPGVNSRLDELQAAFLRVKLAKLPEWNRRRRSVARRYLQSLSSLPIQLPPDQDVDDDVWHIFVIRTPLRDQVITHLRESGIETLIHYPIPPHKQAAFKERSHLSLPVAEELSRTVLSIPIGPHLAPEEQTRVLFALESFDWTSS